MVTLCVVFCLLAGMVMEKGLERPSVGAVVTVILGMSASLAARRKVSYVHKRIRSGMYVLFNGVFRRQAN